jgi:hypothetical protein
MQWLVITDEGIEKNKNFNLERADIDRVKAAVERVVSLSQVRLMNRHPQPDAAVNPVGEPKLKQNWELERAVYDKDAKERVHFYRRDGRLLGGGGGLSRRFEERCHTARSYARSGHHARPGGAQVYSL